MPEEANALFRSIDSITEFFTATTVYFINNYRINHKISLISITIHAMIRKQKFQEKYAFHTSATLYSANDRKIRFAALFDYGVNSLFFRL